MSHVAETAGDTVYPEHVAEGKMSQLLANLGRFASRQESHTRNTACEDLYASFSLKIRQESASAEMSLAVKVNSSV
jgi:hypothetical protein